jgi:RNA polymerase sigma-70 factor (ECF subfamily)
MMPPEEEPEALVVARETIELTFIALIQLLPPRQRAVLILRDVLGWSAVEAAAMLEISVPAANSALQRARASIGDELPEPRPSELTEAERRLLEGFIDTHERADTAGAVALMREDIRVTMPPHPFLYEGRDALAPLLERAFGADSLGDWKLVPTAVNRMPAAASYLRRPGDSLYRAFKLDVLRERDGLAAEITTFDAALFDALGLPAVLPE